MNKWIYIMLIALLVVSGLAMGQGSARLTDEGPSPMDPPEPMAGWHIPTSPAMCASDGFIFVMNGNMLLKFDNESLELVKSKKISLSETWPQPGDRIHNMRVRDRR